MEALRQDTRVITYDMLGHGGSALAAAAPSLEDYAAQLARLLDSLQVEAAHIVGHSMGALVALEFALRYPARTLSVVALNAVYDRTPAQREAVMQRAAALHVANRDSATTDAARHDPSIDATIARWFDDPVPWHLMPVADLVRSLLRSVNPLGYARTYQLFASSDAAHVGTPATTRDAGALHDRRMRSQFQPGDVSCDGGRGAARPRRNHRQRAAHDECDRPSGEPIGAALYSPSGRTRRCTNPEEKAP